MKIKDCKIAINVSNANGTIGIKAGTKESITNKNKSSPLIFPKSRKESEIMREKCEITSTTNINGAKTFTGPMKCFRYFTIPFLRIPSK